MSGRNTIPAMPPAPASNDRSIPCAAYRVQAVRAAPSATTDLVQARAFCTTCFGASSPWIRPEMLMLSAGCSNKRTLMIFGSDPIEPVSDLNDVTDQLCLAGLRKAGGDMTLDI